jgi:3-phenylpropionate/cinnamic acid dioxygenase small subunit
VTDLAHDRADVGADLRSRLMEFLLEESAALDERRYGDWLGFLTEDFLYEMPVPLSREDPSLPQHASGLYLAHESKSFLSMRFGRVDSDYAWAERPAAFLRHFVCNLRLIDAGEDDSRWTVATNVMVVRSRLPEPPTLSSAGRRDVIVLTDEGLRLQHRTVFLDAELPNDTQTSIIY